MHIVSFSGLITSLGKRELMFLLSLTCNYATPLGVVSSSFWTLGILLFDPTLELKIPFNCSIIFWLSLPVY